MDNPRIFLWLALLFLVWLNVDAWMKDYGRPGAPSAPAATAPATAAGGSPASPLAESLPTVGAPAAGTANAGSSGGGVPTGGTFAPGTVIHVVTDVLDMDISLTGGDIVRADLLEYPLKKDNPDLKVRLFNTDSTDSLFLYESGLTTGQAGRAEPNHKALFAAARSEYRLEPGEQELRIPLTWIDEQGLSVTKTFVLRRGGYAIDVSYDIDNATGEAVPLSPYAQLLRHWVPVERSMFNVERDRKSVV